jgi:CDP-paratose synthetase
MKILITGITGFVGKNLLPLLQIDGNELLLIVRDANKINSWNVLNESTNCIFTTDADWKDTVKSFKPEVVLHLATFSTSLDDAKSIDQLIQSNLQFGTHLLDALKGTSLKAFINVGTFAEYHNNSRAYSPAYLYAATKTAFRSVVQYYQAIEGFKSFHVVPYTIYGAADTQKKLINYIVDSFDASEAVKMTPGEQELDFIHIEDVVHFFVTLISSVDQIEGSFHEIHLGTGVGTTPKRIASILETYIGKKANIEWGGRPYRPLDTMLAKATHHLPSTIINWKPTITIEEGLRRYVASK